MKSKAIVFVAPRTVEWREETVPDPAPTELIVQTRVSLISTGTESWCYRGEFDADTGWAAWVKHPFYPGYSNVGAVVKVGKEVTGVREGDRLFTTASHRQYAVVPASNRLVKIPAHTTDDDAAWSMLAVITQTSVRQAEHAMGDTAVVIGLGPLGQLVTQYLRLLGLQEILAIDVAAKRLELASAHGATRTFCGSAGDAVEFVKAHTEGRLADAVYDVTGHYSVFPKALALVRQFGRLMLLGDTPHPSRQHLTQDLLRRQIRVIGSHNEALPPQHAHWTAPRQIELFFAYIHRGQMRVADLVTHRFSPADAARVYADLQQDRGGTMGILFDWNGVR
jgi:2-desacetyl-2-hydroxyethyl bacteriochlorophyllide A dehydrogenase